MSRLSEHRWRVLVSDANLDGKRYRVVRPARPLVNASLHEDWHGAHMSIHQEAARDLAAAWWLAARSPHSIIHLPLRRTGHVDCEGDERPLDLVLLHHSLGFRAADWKVLRGRTANGAPHTVDLPERPFPAVTPADHEAVRFRENLDHFRATIAADTWFVVGSREAFRLASGQIQELVEDSPAFLAGRPDGHVCAEIDLGRWQLGTRRRNSFGTLHIQICETHR